MCLIIHKPAGARIPHALLHAAARFNADGWGLMGFGAGGQLLLERHAGLDVEALLAAEAANADAEYALHLRRQTRGSGGVENAHPFRVVDGLYLMHNGTLPIAPAAPRRSDTWHFAAEVLRPLAQRHPGLFSDFAFIRLLELSLRPENKLAVLDQRHRRIVLVNRQHGADFEELWLSNTRWIDRRLFALDQTPQPQERTWSAAAVHFL